MPLLSSFRLVVGRPSSSSFGTRTWWHVLCKPEATSASLCWKDLDFLKQVILGALSAVNVRQCTTAVFWEDGFQCFHPKMKRNGNREWRGTDVLAVAAVSPCMSGSKRQATQLKSTSLICLMDFPKAGTQQIGYLLVYGNKLHRVNAECWHCKFGQHLLIACFFLIFNAVVAHSQIGMLSFAGSPWHHVQWSPAVDLSVLIFAGANRLQKVKCSLLWSNVSTL